MAAEEDSFSLLIINSPLSINADFLVSVKCPEKQLLLKFSSKEKGIGRTYCFCLNLYISSITRQSKIKLLCTLPGRRPGIAEGDERTRLGRVHLYFFLLFTKYSFLGYYRLLLLKVTMPKTEATN